eukprot:3031546-Alexandrium_andersonii.AAC.1
MAWLKDNVHRYTSLVVRVRSLMSAVVTASTKLRRDPVARLVLSSTRIVAVAMPPAPSGHPLDLRRMRGEGAQ